MKRFDTVLYWTAVIVVGLLLGLPVLLFIFGSFFASFWAPPSY